MFMPVEGPGSLSVYTGKRYGTISFGRETSTTPHLSLQMNTWKKGMSESLLLIKELRELPLTAIITPCIGGQVITMNKHNY